MAGLPVQAVAFSIFAGVFGISTYIISQFKSHPENYRRGTIIRLHPRKGYGTIRPDDKRTDVRVYFHPDHPLAHDLHIGDRVGFTSHYGTRHRPRALNVVAFRRERGPDGKESVTAAALPTREPAGGEESDVSRASASSVGSVRVSDGPPASGVSSGVSSRRHTLAAGEGRPARVSRSRRDSAAVGSGERRRRSPPWDCQSMTGERYCPAERHRRPNCLDDRYIKYYC